ncbi:hypothetical protein ACR3K2_33680, partial [Cryptosporidium serpentis]
INKLNVSISNSLEKKNITISNLLEQKNTSKSDLSERRTAYMENLFNYKNETEMIKSTINFIESECSKVSVPGLNLAPEPKCCNSIMTFIETEAICNSTELINYDFSLQDHVELYNIQENYCKVVEKIRKQNIELTDLIIAACIMVSEYEVLTLPARKLQFSMSPLTTPFSLTTAGATLGNYMFGGPGPCGLTLSLYFVRACATRCDTHSLIGIGRSSIPVSCIAQCEQFTEDACMRGCRRYGCSVPYYECMNMMCSF